MATGNGTLEGKVAIVTGGGTGLGKASALLLAKEGADVVIAARRVNAIEQTATEVRDIGSKALPIPTDVTDTAAVNSMLTGVIGFRHNDTVSIVARVVDGNGVEGAPGNDGGMLVQPGNISLELIY